MGGPDARVAVMTGGAGGIGLATARRLAGDGATVFTAASAMVLNGAHLGRAASIAARAVVHLGAIVAPQTRIPVGWLPAVTPPQLPARPGRGDPGRTRRDRVELPAGHLRRRRRRRPGRALRAALQRYTAAMARHHRQDQMA